MPLSRDRFAPVLATLALVLAWIWPFASGPSPAVMPWLVSAACLSIWVLVTLWFPIDVCRHIAIAWLVAALINSGIGLVQFFGASAEFKPWINVTALGDAFGNLRQRNQFASLVNIGLAVVLWGPLAAQRQLENSNEQAQRVSQGGVAQALVLGCVALLATANAASSSRTGLLQLSVLLVLAWWWRSAGRRVLVLRVLFAMAVYALASVMLPLVADLDPLRSGIAGRFGDGDRACGNRRVLWSNVLYLITQRPLTGWGWGELDRVHFMTVYPGERFCDILDNAHNLPLHLAVELGLPTAIVTCVMIGWLVVRAQPWRETVGRRQLAWAVLGVVGLHSMLEYPLWYGPFQIAVALAVWILWRDPQPPLTSNVGNPDGVTCVPVRESSNSRFFVVWMTALTVSIFGAVSYAAWDYRRVSQIYRLPEKRAAAYRDDTMAKISGSLLFRNQVRFAALTLTKVTPENAQAINDAAHDLMGFSPEGRVVEKLIDSALLLNRPEEAAFYMRRYQIAYPKDYSRWHSGHGSANALPNIDR